VLQAEELARKIDGVALCFFLHASGGMATSKRRTRLDLNGKFKTIWLSFARCGSMARNQL
jgi:hypothetical protein